MNEYPKQVILVSDFAHRDFWLKDMLGHDPTYNGLLNQSAAQVPTLIFESLTEEQKNFTPAATDVQKIIEYQSKGYAEVKIALNYQQTMQLTTNLLEARMHIEAFLLYRTMEDTRSTIDLLLSQEGFNLHNMCHVQRPSPIFIISSPKTDGKEEEPEPEHNPFSPFRAEEIQRRKEEREAKREEELKIIEQIKARRQQGVVYLEDKRLATAMKLLEDIHKDPFTYGELQNVGHVIRSAYDFLNDPPESCEDWKVAKSIYEPLAAPEPVPIQSLQEPQSREEKLDQVINEVADAMGVSPDAPPYTDETGNGKDFNREAALGMLGIKDK